MNTRNKMLLCAVCIALIVISIVTDVIDFDFANVMQTICGVVVLLCLLVLFVSIDSPSNEAKYGSLIVNDADEVYLVLDKDISELRKKSHVDLSVYLSHSS
jgi:hypothetical protein